MPRKNRKSNERQLRDLAEEIVDGLLEYEFETGTSD